MYSLSVLIIVLIVVLILGGLYTVFKQRINFFITGLDSGFSLSEISLLWETARFCDLDQPNALFFSLPSLTKCMSQISNETNEDGSPKNQLLMSKLFDYRTKIQNEADNKKGLSTTHSLEKGQPLRIILPGKGVFSSELVNNGSQLIISIPKQKNMIPLSGEEWVGKVISVYLWRKGDARYVFDTSVTQQGLFLGKSALFLKHSANLVRTQKRKSVRVKCEINGMLYIIKKDNIDINAIETQNGFRCIIEDISESGALIKIGGKGVQNVKIKLQFNMNNRLILMFGIIRTVEFNQEKNQSLLHFECTHIQTSMRNEILKFVYNMLPDNEKEVLDAIAQTEEDSSGEAGESIEKNAEIDKTQAVAREIEKSVGITEVVPLEEIGPDEETENQNASENNKTESVNQNKDSEYKNTKNEISQEDEINVF